MAAGKLLRQLLLICSAADGNLDAFRGVAAQMIADERQKRHLLADDFETILNCRASNERPMAAKFKHREFIHGAVDRFASDSFGRTVAVIVPLLVPLLVLLILARACS